MLHNVRLKHAPVITSSMYAQPKRAARLVLISQVLLWYSSESQVRMVLRLLERGGGSCIAGLPSAESLKSCSTPHGMVGIRANMVPTDPYIDALALQNKMGCGAQQRSSLD